MGIISASSSQLSDRAGIGAVLFTPVQQRVLGLLYGQPERRFQSAELIRLAASGTGATHRLLARLADSGLVTVEWIGNQKHYQANRASPVFKELHGLVVKTSGLDYPLRDAPAGARPALHAPTAAYAVDSSPRQAGGQKLRVSQARLAAMCKKYGIAKLSLFGSASRNELTPESDVDLMVEFLPESRASLFDMPAMQDEFSAAFGGRRVDIATPEILSNPYRREMIVPDLKPIYEA